MGALGTLVIEDNTEDFKGFKMTGSWNSGEIAGILYFDTINYTPEGKWVFVGGWKAPRHKIYKPLTFEFNNKFSNFLGRWANLEGSGEWLGQKVNHSNALVPGLKNFGNNNCYMNSILQCFSH